MEQKHKTNKSRDIAIGFFGWFLIGSLIVWIVELSHWDLPLFHLLKQGTLNFAVPVVTVIVIGILFFMKRKWFAYGIVAAVFTNTLIFMLLFSLVFGMGWDGVGLSLLYGPFGPFFMVGGYF